MKKYQNSNYYERNKEKILEQSRQRYLLIKDTPEYKALKLKNAKARYKNKREHITNQRRERNKKARLEVMNLLGGAVCKSCGYTDMRALQFDHIDGSGRVDRKKYGGQPTKVWARIKREQHLFQVLCANCNSIKRHEERENYWDHYVEKVEIGSLPNFRETYKK